MNDGKLSPDDPKVTAYALGELPRAQRPDVEAALRRQPELMASVEHTRHFAAQLQAALAQEPDIVEMPVRRDKEAGGSSGTLPPHGSKITRLPRLYFVLGGLAAACLAVVVTRYRSPESRAPRISPAEAVVSAEVAAPPSDRAVDDAEPVLLADAVGPATPRTPSTDTMLNVSATAAPRIAGDVAAPLLEQAKVQPAGENLRVAPVLFPSVRATVPSISGLVTTTPRPAAPTVEHAETKFPTEFAEKGLASAAPLSLAEGPMPASAEDTVEEQELSGDQPSVPVGGEFVSPARVARSSFSLVAPVEPRAVRMALVDGRLPDRNAVRIEELLNYFVGLPDLRGGVGAGPIVTLIECAAAPWDPRHRLLRIVIAGRAPPDDRGGAAGAVVATSVGLHVDFNPARVASYRLIGYEADATGVRIYSTSAASNQLRAGQVLTALYEIVPVPDGNAESVQSAYGPVRHLGYGPERRDTPDMLTLRVRFRDAEGERPRRIDLPFVDRGMKFEDASQDFAFAAAVAHFGMRLRGAKVSRSLSWNEITSWAAKAPASARRAEFIELVQRAKVLVK